MMCAPTGENIKAELDSAVGTDFTVLEFDKDKLWTNPAVVPENCTMQTSQVFAQYTCIQSNDQLKNKYNTMSACTALAVFASLFFSLFVIGFGAKQKLQAIEWDLNTVTVADYAVEFAITPEAYQMWYQDHYAECGDEANNVP